MQKQSPTVTVPTERRDERAELSFDQPLHAAVARLTGGISPIAFSLACTDWAQHLAASPDKQIGLARKAARKWTRFLEYAPPASTEPGCPRCIEPLCDAPGTYVLRQ